MQHKHKSLVYTNHVAAQMVAKLRQAKAAWVHPYCMMFKVLSLSLRKKRKGFSSVLSAYA